jgi:hypothetical protein
VASLFSFSDQNFVCTNLLPHAKYISYPHLLSTEHNIRWTQQIMNIMYTLLFPPFDGQIFSSALICQTPSVLFPGMRPRLTHI